MVAASEDLASQNACLWCYMKKQQARGDNHKEYQKLARRAKLPRKQKKSHGGSKMHSKLPPKDLKLNPSVPSPRFIYSTAEGKRRAKNRAMEEKAKHCQRKEVKAHSFNSLCTIQEAEEEEDDDESATGTNVFYNVHMCVHAYERARSTGSGPRNEAIHRLVKICDFGTLQHSDITELESKLEDLDRN